MRDFDLLTVKRFYDETRKTLASEWVGGKSGGAKEFAQSHSKSRIGIVGHFNTGNIHQVHLLDGDEMEFLSSLSAEVLDAALKRLFDKSCCAVIVANRREPTASMFEYADRRGIGLFKSEQTGEQLLSKLHHYLSRELAEKTTLHGVFMEVINIGVLLTGDSGVGKSELALELISHGHHLITDDAPIFARIAPDIVEGYSPPAIEDFLEVRGLGILNIRKMYGDDAIKKSKYLKLIIELKDSPDSGEANRDRLRSDTREKNILGLPIPVYALPVAAGRNLAVLIEAAVKTYVLRSNHYYAEQEIAERQAKLIAGAE